MNLRNIVENLVEIFLEAGDLALRLREKGLIKKIKTDKTPVSNGDLEVNRLISTKISEVTPDLPIISEESSDCTKFTKAEPNHSILSQFQPLFEPKTVAVLGASSKSKTIANTFIRRLKDFGYPGNIYPIHPTVHEIVVI